MIPDAQNMHMYLLQIPSNSKVATIQVDDATIQVDDATIQVDDATIQVSIRCHFVHATHM